MKVTICFKGLLGTGIKRETKTHIRRSFYSLDIMNTPKGYIMSIKDKIKINPTARRSNQSVLKEINPECSLEGLILKLKL